MFLPGPTRHGDLMGAEIAIRDDGRPEWPNASTLALARLVCEHGTVLWVSFGPAPVTLRPQPSEARRGCRCQPAIAAIYPDRPKDGPQP